MLYKHKYFIMNDFKFSPIKYKRIREITETICNPLETEDYVVQPIFDVSPPKWHLAHTAWFFEQFILIPYKKDYKIFNESYNFIFNSYYEHHGERVMKANRGNLSRPTVEDIYKYRKYVDKHILEFYDKPQDKKLRFFLELGLHHEQQHQELLIYDIKYILGHNPLLPAYHKTKPELNSIYSKAKCLEIHEGMYDIGYNGNRFYFDNEKPLHKKYLPDYSISSKPVTNEEYLEFLEDDSYHKFSIWLSDGWDWINKNNTDKPLYWHKIDGKWYEYTLFGLLELDMNAPVTHISYYEADAFAQWKGKRLPTEFEWEIASKIYENEIPDNTNFLNKFYFQPIGLKSVQFLGNVWEWTNSSYLPYPGYQKDDGALGEYNGKFMINQMVLKGGSCATPTDHIRHSYRNFFQTDKRWLFSGFRLADNIQ